MNYQTRPVIGKDTKGSCLARGPFVLHGNLMCVRGHVIIKRQKTGDAA